MVASGKRLTLLTIAIPTYNRAEELNGLLENLTSIKRSTNVRILVGDNGSTDHTNVVVTKWQEFYGPCFSSIRNPSNLGFDQNVIKLYENAKTDYVWFLSDEDRPELESLEEILSILDSRKLGLLIASQFNSPQIGEASVEADLCPYQPTKKKIIHRIDSDIEVNTPINRAAIILMASQISTSILRTGVELPKDLKSFGGLPQSYIGHLALLTHPFARISGKPLTSLASKNVVSDWFLESCFFGTLAIYSRPELELPTDLRNQIINSNIQFGISILIDSVLRNKSVDFNTKRINYLLTWDGLDLNNHVGIRSVRLFHKLRFILVPLGSMRNFLGNKLVALRYFLSNLIRASISSRK